HGDDVAGLVERLVLHRPARVREALVALESVVPVNGCVAVAGGPAPRRSVERVGEDLRETLRGAQRRPLRDHQVALVVHVLRHVSERLDLTDESAASVSDERFADDLIAAKDSPFDNVTELVIAPLLTQNRLSCVGLSSHQVGDAMFERLDALNLVVVRVVGVIDPILERRPAERGLDATHSVVHEPRRVALPVEYFSAVAKLVVAVFVHEMNAIAVPDDAGEKPFGMI